MFGRFTLTCTLVLALSFASLIAGTAHTAADAGLNACSKVRPSGWWDHCSFDDNRNGIDDQLELLYKAHGLDYRTNIFVDYAYHPTLKDVARLRNFDGELKYVYQYINTTCMRNVRMRDIERIFSLPGVVMIEIEPEVRAMLDSSVAALRVKESSVYPLGVWNDTGVTGKGVNIAVLDSGVDNNHASLDDMDDDASTDDPKFIAGVDWTRNLVILDGSDDPNDVDGHGSHCAGIALGTGGWSYDYRGVAPGARLVDVKVMKNWGSGSGGDIISGIEWCISNRNKDWEGTGQNVGIQVLSMSLGGRFDDDGSAADAQAVDRAVDNGLVVCVATGNDGMQRITNPASADKCIAVGASDDINTITRTDDVWAYYSNYGPRQSDNDLDHYDELKPDVICPGTNIMSVMANSPAAFVPMTGTSMSTPHVAGVAALMIEANRNITPAQVKTILQEMAEPHGTPYDTSLSEKYNTTWGYGSLEAFGAVKRAMDIASNRITAPDSVPSGTNVNFESKLNLTRTEYSKLKESVRFQATVPTSWGAPTAISGYSEGTGYTFESTTPSQSLFGWRFTAWINYTSFATSTVDLHPKITFQATAPNVVNNQDFSITTDVFINALTCAEAQKSITVTGGQPGVDLSIGNGDITFSPEAPVAGDQVTISAVVHNGGTDSATAQVKFYNGTPQADQSNVIGQDTVTVAGGSTDTASATWTPPGEGTYNIFACADPSNEVAETNELNNNDSRLLTVQPQTANQQPVAVLAVSPMYGIIGQQITFNGSGSYDPDGSVQRYQFEFGDGASYGPTTDASTTHSYSSAGTYMANLTVWDNELNKSAPAQKVVTITVDVTRIPVYFDGASSISVNAPSNTTEKRAVIQSSTTLWPLGTWTSAKWDENAINGTCELEFFLVKDSGSGSVELNFTLNAGGHFIGSIQRDFSSVNTTVKRYNATLPLTTYAWPEGERLSIEVSSRTSSTGIALVYGSVAYPSCIKMPFLMPINILPNANAGADVSAKVNETVFFDGTNSTDPDGTIASYKWKFNDPYCSPSSNTASTAKASHVFTRAGQYVVELNVTDDDGGVSSSSLVVTIVVDNVAPRITAYSPAMSSLTMSENETMKFNVTATDANGDTLSYQWFLDGQRLAGKTAREYSYFASYVSAGNHTVRVQVSDGIAAVDHTWNITVINVNLPPEIKSFEPANEVVLTNETTSVRFAISAYDTDGNAGLQYAWFLDGNMLAEESGSSYIYLSEPDYKSNGTHTISVRVTDAEGESATKAWTVYVINVNRAPVASFDSAPKGSIFDKGSVLTLTSHASDPDGDELTFAWFLDGRQVSSGTTASLELSEKGTHEIMLIVTDSNGATATATKTIQVIVNETAATPGFEGYAMLCALACACLLASRKRR